MKISKIFFYNNFNNGILSFLTIYYFIIKLIYNKIEININKIQDNIIIKMNIAKLEKQEYPMLFEGTLRHQNNINIAKKKYGNTFNCKIINTNYFGDETIIPTLVVSDDISLVLGNHDTQTNLQMMNQCQTDKIYIFINKSYFY